MTEREMSARPDAPSVAAPQRADAPVAAGPTRTAATRTVTSGVEHGDNHLRNLIIQAKLTVGPAGDPFEREADAVAAQVVRTLRSGVEPPEESRVQRATRRHESPVSTAPAAGVRRIQRAANAATIGRDGGDLDANTTRLLRSSRSGGAPLPDDAKSKMESAFGADFGGVRVHTGPTSTELNDRIQAQAFTTGSDIYFRDSLPDVNSSSGQELLAHELTHTIQQGASGVHRTSDRVQRNGLTDWMRGKLGWDKDAGAAAEPDRLEKVHIEFMRRVTAIQSEIPQLKGQNVAETGEALWAAYSGTISGKQGMSSGGGEVDLGAENLSNKVPESAPGRRDNKATNPMYYNEGPGPGAAPGEKLAEGSYKTNMSESFNLLTTALKGLSQLQFDKYDTFAFWNSPGAKDVAVAAKGSGVLALESSAIGGLFDGFGSYAELSSGIDSKSWDPQLWAELSRAYAAMVMDAIVKDRSKKIIVICGIGFDNPGFNIWNSIESLTLKLGAERSKIVQSDLDAATTYFGVAGHMDGNNPVVNMASSFESIAGTWVSAKTPAEMVKWQKAQITSQSK